MLKFLPIFKNTAKLSLIAVLALSVFACASHKKSSASNLAAITESQPTHLSGVDASAKTVVGADIKENKSIGANDLATQESDKKYAEYQNENYNADPYEKFNRKVYAFNRGVDKIIIKPVAKVYDFVMPDPVKKCVNNFFNNLSEFNHIANDLMQLNFKYAAHDTGRLLINSTVGVFGLIDVGTYIGAERHEQSMGVTFAKWGNERSPYLVLPVLGSSTVRDTVGLVPDFFAISIWPFVQPDGRRWALTGMDMLDSRVQLLPSDKVIDESYDPYLFVKTSYLQHRTYLINQAKGVSQEEETADTYVGADGDANSEAASLQKTEKPEASQTLEKSKAVKTALTPKKSEVAKTSKTSSSPKT
jgi:phospholipid-binding lipoprotein MlaA